MREYARTPEGTCARIKEVRAQAIERARQARKLAAERRELMQSLINDGLSQFDIARELGVTRQAIYKMLSFSPLPLSPDILTLPRAGKPPRCE
jgi:DNA invertase Pin-like site-specific DNA recombinase